MIFESTLAQLTKISIPSCIIKVPQHPECGTTMTTEHYVCFQSCPFSFYTLATGAYSNTHHIAQYAFVENC
jgi:hypothetical protein